MLASVGTMGPRRRWETKEACFSLGNLSLNRANYSSYTLMLIMYYFHPWVRAFVFRFFDTLEMVWGSTANGIFLWNTQGVVGAIVGHKVINVGLML